MFFKRKNIVKFKKYLSSFLTKVKEEKKKNIQNYLLTCTIKLIRILKD